MNKAEAIEAMKNKYVYWQNAVGIINSIQPTTDEALKVLGENYQMTSEQYEEIWGKGMDYGMADRLIKEKTGRSLWDHVQDNFEDFNKPQKVVIPKFVAQWIKFCKNNAELSACLMGRYNNGNRTISIDDFDKFADWIGESDNESLLARAWLDDYEIEKEKLYRVELPTDSDNDIKTYFTGFTEKSVTPEFSYIQKDALNFVDFEKAKSVACFIIGNVREVEETGND